MLSALILIPLLGAAALTVLPRSLARSASLAVSAAAAVVAAIMWGRFDSSSDALQFVGQYDWMPAIGAQFLLGVDGLSMMLVLLTALVVPFALVSGRQTSRSYHVLMLVTQSALFGTFTAQNFVPWFLFYEMSLIPAFLLIKMFGSGNRDRASMTFFLYTFLGSAAMLLAMLGVYYFTGTFDFREFWEVGARTGAAGLVGGKLPWFLFAGVFLGLAVKVPVFPFHSWLPEAYASAPSGVSMVLTGLLSKMGVYGFVRLLLPLFPAQIQAIQPWLLAVVLCSIVLGSLAAWAQRDIKRMLGYISINHLGYCVLAMVAVAGTAKASAPDVQAALAGTFMQIFNHGITAAALFYYAGLLEDRRGTRMLGDFGGLMQATPRLCAFISIAMFSSLGLPGLNGFIGEILIFKGAFGLVPVATSIAALGLLFTAVVFLNAMKSLFSGPLSEACTGFPELTRREMFVAVPASLLMLAIGVAPQFMFQIFNSTVIRMGTFF